MFILREMSFLICFRTEIVGQHWTHIKSVCFFFFRIFAVLWWANTFHMDTNTQQNVDMIKPCWWFTFHTMQQSSSKLFIRISSERHFWMSIVVLMSCRPLSWKQFFSCLLLHIQSHHTLHSKHTVIKVCQKLMVLEDWLVWRERLRSEIQEIQLYGHVSEADSSS